MAEPVVAVHRVHIAHADSDLPVEDLAGRISEAVQNAVAKRKRQYDGHTDGQFDETIDRRGRVKSIYLTGSFVRSFLHQTNIFKADGTIRRAASERIMLACAISLSP